MHRAGVVAEIEEAAFQREPSFANAQRAGCIVAAAPSLDETVADLAILGSAKNDRPDIETRDQIAHYFIVAFQRPSLRRHFGSGTYCDPATMIVALRLRLQPARDFIFFALAKSQIEAWVLQRDAKPGLAQTQKEQLGFARSGGERHASVLLLEVRGAGHADKGADTRRAEIPFVAPDARRTSAGRREIDQAVELPVGK